MLYIHLVSLPVLLYLASSLLPLFDASPLLLPYPASPLLRWDVLHFLAIARHGYLYDHLWAFLAPVPLLLRAAPALTHHPVLPLLLAAPSALMLHALSLHHLRRPSLARLATLLSLIPTSPVTLWFAPYNEPFFTFLSYSGMLACARRKWLLASLCFALATSFRSNGLFLSGFLLWDILVRPFLLTKKLNFLALSKAVLYTAIAILPLVAHQTYAYLIFCTSPSSVPDWCSHRPPSIYAHVQSKYWNIGFLRYWTPSQIPNFLLAAPTLSLLFAYAYHHFRPLRQFHLQPLLLSPITPHAIHALIFGAILLFASHTQIVLRLAPSMPFIYWAAAWLYTEHPRLGTLWITWSIMWGWISTVLWATFLPPA